MLICQWKNVDMLSIHVSHFGLLGWLYLKAHFGCLSILMLGRSPIKCRQRPDVTIAVYCDVKFKQTDYLLESPIFSGDFDWL